MRSGRTDLTCVKNHRRVAIPNMARDWAPDLADWAMYTRGRSRIPSASWEISWASARAAARFTGRPVSVEPEAAQDPSEVVAVDQKVQFPPDLLQAADQEVVPAHPALEGRCLFCQPAPIGAVAVEFLPSLPGGDTHLPALSAT
jgi:hypothetical protein